MIERDGKVVIHLLDNVKQKTIEPFIKDKIESGTLVYTYVQVVVSQLFDFLTNFHRAFCSSQRLH